MECPPTRIERTRPRVLARLQGIELKNSNEKVWSDYGNLAKYVVGKYAKAFRLYPDQRDDLLQSILVELFNAPPSYRNYKGISLMLKHKMRGVIRKAIKYEPEIQVGLMRREKEISFPEPAYTPGRDVTHGVELGLILKRLDLLTSSERTVLSLLYGLDGNQVFSTTMVAKKLSRDESWVCRKEQKAIARIREVMKIN